MILATMSPLVFVAVSPAASNSRNRRLISLWSALSRTIASVDIALLRWWNSSGIDVPIGAADSSLCGQGEQIEHRFEAAGLERGTLSLSTAACSTQRAQVLRDQFGVAEVIERGTHMCHQLVHTVPRRRQLRRGGEKLRGHPPP